MTAHGWKQLVDGWPWFRGAGNYPVFPNSEYMQPVRLGRKPYGTWTTPLLDEDDPYGWPITEYDEKLMLRPGLHDLARHVLAKLVPLCRQDDSHHISEYKLRDNPYWPAELANRSANLKHERFVLLLPLALSITTDDKAHQRWTLFGNCEQHPGRAFWRGFYTAPGEEWPAEHAIGFFRTLLVKAYDEPRENLADLRRAGFRILASDADEGPLPAWTADYRVTDEKSLRSVKYLLTFQPFRDLPAIIKRRYLAGQLQLLPFPGSLLFWGVRGYPELCKRLRLVEQTPLLHFVERHETYGKLRIPQSGWFEEFGPAHPGEQHPHGPMRESYKRTYRQVRAHRFADHLVNAHEHRLPHVLFSTRPQDINLYYKPMARNAQIWTKDFEPLLNGPTATPADICGAAETVAAGGVFGYRFLFPAMRVGAHELYWHRPLVAFMDRRGKPHTLLDDAPLGSVLAYPADRMDFAEAVELWPRLLSREAHVANLECFHHLEEFPPRRTMTNVMKILDAQELAGAPVSPTFARQLLTTDKRRTLEGWLRRLCDHVKPKHRECARWLIEHLRGCIGEPSSVRGRSPVAATAGPSRGSARQALTFEHTATRTFEEEYWNAIAHLSSGDYVNKNNADCVLDKHTQELLRHHGRDLEGMGDYLLDYYDRLIASLGMKGKAQAGELPFRWETEFPFPWMGGWLHNQEGKTYERNLLVKIPGRDRRRAVIMADHYDTAYMHDRYDHAEGGCGARIAAAGADDNCSATAALMLGAKPFLDLSKRGLLDCDVWLVHLTGEEYPAEGIGTCRMCQWLVEGSLKLRTLDGKEHEQSKVQIQGVYVLDMIAHNVEAQRDVFQIAPGASREAMWLAEQAHLANVAWNELTEKWNRQAMRRSAGRGKRSRDGKSIPKVARHLPLYGEVRPHYDPRTTLFNTDGQQFSDHGIPVVLFMENYDIDRIGYHDMHDNMTLIDLDYGAAFAAITIESVARAASALG